MSIPLNGYHLFLLSGGSDKPWECYSVSIPLNGYHLFLQQSWKINNKNDRAVSIPLNGYHLFLLSQQKGNLGTRNCVNSLKRVSPISTVCLHMPLKSRLSHRIFAGNCQNILTLNYFRPIFCFLKNCIQIYTIFYLTVTILS